MRSGGTTYDGGQISREMLLVFFQRSQERMGGHTKRSLSHQVLLYSFTEVLMLVKCFQKPHKYMGIQRGVSNGRFSVTRTPQAAPVCAKITPKTARRSPNTLAAENVPFIYSGHLSETVDDTAGRAQDSLHFALFSFILARSHAPHHWEGCA